MSMGTIYERLIEKGKANIDRMKCSFDPHPRSHKAIMRDLNRKKYVYIPDEIRDKGKIIWYNYYVKPLREADGTFKSIIYVWFTPPAENMSKTEMETYCKNVLDIPNYEGVGQKAMIRVITTYDENNNIISKVKDYIENFSEADLLKEFEENWSVKKYKPPRAAKKKETLIGYKLLVEKYNRKVINDERPDNLIQLEGNSNIITETDLADVESRLCHPLSKSYKDYWREIGKGAWFHGHTELGLYDLEELFNKDLGWNDYEDLKGFFVFGDDVDGGMYYWFIDWQNKLGKGSDAVFVADKSSSDNFTYMGKDLMQVIERIVNDTEFNK
ncbi:hypothetical protein FACS189462_0500 [Spirochaetia bacterium]|nr:hypothetical protein FACS189462_0500 [Spirochaetia bacterium]